MKPVQKHNSRHSPQKANYVSIRPLSSLGFERIILIINV